MRALVLLAVLLVGLLGPAAAEDPAFRTARAPFGQSPPAEARILVECHGDAPLVATCAGSFDAVDALVYTSSCDRTPDSCSRFTGKLRMRFHDGVTPDDVLECYFDAGLRQGCERKTSIAYVGHVTLTVEVRPQTLLGQQVPVAPEGGWHVWLVG